MQKRSKDGNTDVNDTSIIHYFNSDKLDQLLNWQLKYLGPLNTNNKPFYLSNNDELRGFLFVEELGHCIVPTIMTLSHFYTMTLTLSHFIFKHKLI